MVEKLFIEFGILLSIILIRFCMLKITLATQKLRTLVYGKINFPDSSLNVNYKLKFAM